MPSIEPVSPPYSERVIASFETIMPKGVPPLGIFRVLAHNGEINTVRGNVNWMNARRRMIWSRRRCWNCRRAAFAQTR